MSVCHVTETTLYYRGLPASGGLLDPLMGSVDRRHKCVSCACDARTCQGHPGHIELPYPCYHIGFIDTVLKILRVTCFFCARVCATPDDEAAVSTLLGKNRFQALYTSLRNRKTCPHCQAFRPSYTRNALGLRIEWPVDVEWEDEEEEAYCKKSFTAREAFSVLRNLTPEDVILLGFDPDVAHPANMIMQNLVVPPPCTRPAIYSSEGSRSRGQNELTIHLMEILKRAHDLRNFMQGVAWVDYEVNDEMLDRLVRLQYELFMLVNCNARVPKPASMSRNSGCAQVKSLTDRLKGKEGRIRGNLMGKRVDFSARCVISPDAYFDCDRVGVPHHIAMRLTIPETVNANNVKALSERVRRGAGDVHGADTVISASGTITSLSSCRNREDIVLRAGDVVERFLADDDVVVFNRQPSLHMHGMQAHRVRLMPGYTFRLSLVVAAPYNADFDGDEMNIHVPQSANASAECAMLMGVAQNCVSSQANKPVMGIVQDSLLGVYLMSMNSILIDFPHLCRLMGVMRHLESHTLPPADVVLRRGAEETRLWTGKSVISLVLPASLYVETAPLDAETQWNDEELPVTVRAGRLLCGVLKKAHVGTSSGGIVDVLCRDYNGVACMRFMADVQRLTHAFLLQRGHHVGIKDVMLSGDGNRRVTERIAKATRLCEDIQREVGHSSSEVGVAAERSILRLLSKMLLQTGGIVSEHMEKENAIRRMVTAGSKGSFMNLSQICACLGQQSLEGSRIVCEEGQSSLPCFSPDDKSLASRGMVFNSFALGLSPAELFFHAIGGREGLVDTAVKTSQTGYLQRRMNKSMEDHTVHTDGTVRNAAEEVISFRWGSDGMHPAKLERVRLRLLSDGCHTGHLTPRELALAESCKAAILRCKTHLLVTEFDCRVLLPFNPERVRRRLQRACRPDSESGTGDGAASADVDGVWRKVVALDGTVCRTVMLALVDTFCERNVQRVPQREVDALLDGITFAIRISQHVHGESVGCIAAQSIGEPTTQMSAAYSTPILVAIGGRTEVMSIGALVDAYLPPVLCCDQHDIVPVSDLECVGVSSTEKVAWARVTHVSRHPANGDMITVTTKRGRTLEMTASHSFLVRAANRVVQRMGSDLVCGDALPIVKDLPLHTGTLPQSPVPLTRATGRFIGAVVSEGSIDGTRISFANEEHVWLAGVADDFRMDTGFAVLQETPRPGGLDAEPMLRASVSNRDLAAWMANNFFGRAPRLHTALPAWILDAPDEFVTGVLQTYFDGNGNVQTEARRRRLCCRCVTPDLVTMLCLCLARYGIVTYTDTESHVTPSGTPDTVHRITIPACFAAAFQDHIGFSIGRKVEELAELVREHEETDMRGFAVHIPGMNKVLEEACGYISHGGDGNSSETLSRKEFRRIQRKTGITPAMLMRCRESAVRCNAPDALVAELDQAIHADVWWDPIASIATARDSQEMVYDFTVEKDLQSFMLANGVFVHNTLNTFHLAGCASKNVTLGIPRLKELLDTTRSAKTPCTRICFQSPYNRSKEFAEYFANTLPLTRLADVVSHTTIMPSDAEAPSASDAWMLHVEDVLGVETARPSRFVIRMELQQDLMKTRHLTPPMIRSILRDRLRGRATVSSSETTCIDWVVRVRFADVSEMVTLGGLSVDEEAVICHRAANMLMETVVVGGHLHVSSAEAVEATAVEQTGATRTEYVVNTFGKFLTDCISSPCVDWTRCTSNDIWETYLTLGIEACCHVLYDQLKAVVSFDGTYVDDRHLILIVDTICRMGYLMPLNRHGINRTDASPLMRASFEETGDILCDAAMFAEGENAKGVTTSIMTGQLAEMGTGAVQVLFKNNSLARHEEPIPSKGRILRSTCRSYNTQHLPETVEYVLEDLNPSLIRPLSPPGEESVRKRIRFRPASPDLDE